jgi:hypothetical protein
MTTDQMRADRARPNQARSDQMAPESTIGDDARSGVACTACPVRQFAGVGRSLPHSLGGRQFELGASHQ